MRYFTHYKNKPYKFHGVAKHSETLEELVVYECLYDNPTSKLWVRPKEMFFENVVIDGKSIPRFAEVPDPPGRASGEPKHRPLPRIETANLILRLPSLNDIPGILKYFKDNEAHLSPFDPKKPDGFYTENFWHERIPKHTEDFLGDKQLRLYLFNLGDDREVIGSMEFSQISRGPFQACYLGYGIAARHQGKGLMYEALNAAISYVFQEMNIHRIMANHLPENERSAKLLKRLGFSRECIAKDYLRINGAWRDHVLNSLHNPKWKEKA